jgi:bacteriocin-like protein
MTQPKKDLVDFLELDTEQLKNVSGGRSSSFARLGGTQASAGNSGDTTDPKHEHTDDESGMAL